MPSAPRVSANTAAYIGLFWPLWTLLVKKESRSSPVSVFDSSASDLACRAASTLKVRMFATVSSWSSGM